MKKIYRRLKDEIKKKSDVNRKVKDYFRASVSWLVQTGDIRGRMLGRGVSHCKRIQTGSIIHNQTNAFPLDKEERDGIVK